MHHLKLTELARLVEEAPTADETAHLESCERCAAELLALRQQTLALARLPDPLAPEGVHARIERAIRADTRLPRRIGAAAGLRAAAAIAIFVLGGVTGTFVAAPVLTSGSDTPPPALPMGPADAAAAVAAAEAEYLRSLTRYAQITDDGAGLDPLNRLAALEGIVLTTRAALREAPADPVINNYHLTALGQRDALLQHMEDLARGDEWF
jgi:hypothetical protein